MLPEQSKNVLDPLSIVRMLDLKNGDYVADFGSGGGYFIIPLARSVAPNGKIFAIDIQRQMLDLARTKSKLENLHDIEYIWSDLEMPNGSKLKDNFVNLVLITSLLHQGQQKETILKEAYRILMPGGRLVIIEWNMESGGTNLGPPNEMRISKEAAISLCASQLFSIQKEFDAGSHHYGILFVKKV